MCSIRIEVTLLRTPETNAVVVLAICFVQVEDSSPIADARTRVNNLFERCLVFLHKMPVIWALYLEFLLQQGNLTIIRRAFDRALQSLPVTQHSRIWELYIAFALDSGVADLYVRVCRRYLMFNPGAREEHIQHLLDRELWDEAVAQLAKLLQPGSAAMASSSSAYSNFMRLCDVITRHPGEITSVDVDAVLRSGIKRFSDEVGRLWCALAEYYVRAGMFEKARDIYEEALGCVVTVRDFATAFDAYVQFEETLLTAKLNEGSASSSSGVAASSSNASRPIGAGAGSSVGQDDEQLEDAAAVCLELDDADLRIARLELLMDRRPLLLSAVLLRQNPHNVHEWHKRAKLLDEAGVAAKVITTFSEAVRTVDLHKAVGKPHTLWIEWAKYYERHQDLDNARAVFRQATDSGFLKVDDLAAVWCEWAEMELRQENAAGALRVMQQATTPPVSERRRGAGAAADAGGDAEGSDVAGVKRKVHRSTKLWGLYLDLEESLGTVATVRAAYDQSITLRVATPAMVLNYATYLEERNHFEDSFKAYEKGIAIFPWPHVKPLWAAYLKKFIERYGASKLERCRDLFEQAITGCPAADAFLIFSLYADFEERLGSVRHAMAVYDRAVKAVDSEHLYEMYLVYIRKAEEFFGAPRTRELYERAIDALPEVQVKDMCMRFASMETKLGEIERARAIYTHAAAFCDPAVHHNFWTAWQEWEVKFGTEETFRDMLRTKRSIGAQFATSHSLLLNVAEQPGGSSSAAGAAKKRGREGDADESASAAGGGGAGSGAGGALSRFKQTA